MIKSRCYSDDHVVEVDFDATPWFETASDEKIVALMNCHFGGDYGADTVAEDMIDQNAEIKKMFDYIRSIQDSPAKKDALGFECHVDPYQALNWVSKYRPHIDISAVLERIAEDLNMSLFDRVRKLGAQSVCEGLDEVSESDLMDLYDEFLNEVCGEVRIGSLVYEAARALKEVDPVAYRCGFNDWLDSEPYTEIDGRYFRDEDLEKALDDLE